MFFLSFSFIQLFPNLPSFLFPDLRFPPSTANACYQQAHSFYSTLQHPHSFTMSSPSAFSNIEQSPASIDAASEPQTPGGKSPACLSGASFASFFCFLVSRLHRASSSSSSSSASSSCSHRISCRASSSSVPAFELGSGIFLTSRTSWPLPWAHHRFSFSS